MELTDHDAFDRLGYIYEHRIRDGLVDEPDQHVFINIRN